MKTLSLLCCMMMLCAPSLYGQQKTSNDSDKKNLLDISERKQVKDGVFEFSTDGIYVIDSIEVPFNTIDERDNILIQYWDEANWSDASASSTIDESKTTFTFRFVPPMTTDHLRICTRPSAVRTDFKVYGRIIEKDREGQGKTGPDLEKMKIRVTDKIIGKSMQIVGYNQGYFMPESDVCDWLKWSNVNSIRIWLSSKDMVTDDMFRTMGEIKNVVDFEHYKENLRTGKDDMILWEELDKKMKTTSEFGNRMNYAQAIESLKELGISPVIQINTRLFLPDWEKKAELWRTYYVLARYLGEEGQIYMYSTQNEPNHRLSGPVPLETYINGLRIVSDAIHCAIEDVNSKTGSQLEGKLVAPVTAGYNTDWWAAVARAEGIDYKGEKTTRELVDIFSTNSYNRTAEGYRGRVTDIRNLLKENHYQHKEKPVEFTEIGRWMNGLLINKEETMDSPSLFTEWAGIYAQNMLEGCYGMYAFKMSNTRTGTYPSGVKSGHHYTWKGPKIIEEHYKNLAYGKRVTTSDGSDGSVITDNDKTNSSKWVSTSEEKKWFEIDFGKEEKIYGLSLYSGSADGVYTGPDRLRSFKTEVYANGAWMEVPEASEAVNKYTHKIKLLSQGVNAEKIRISSTEDQMKVREIKIFGEDILNHKESYDITQPLRAAHVVRLFAKGFKNSRPLLSCEPSYQDNKFYFCADKAEDGNMYLWAVQLDQQKKTIHVDLSDAGIGAGHLVSVETVGQTEYSDARIIRNENGQFTFEVSPESVNLFTITPARHEESIRPSSISSIRADGYTEKGKTGKISMDATSAAGNEVTVMQFPIRNGLADARKIFLSLEGRSADQEMYKVHVYAFASDQKMKLEKITWNQIPYLDPEEALVDNSKGKAHFAGEFAFYAKDERKSLDITDVAGDLSGKYLNIILVREITHEGDDMDKGRSALVQMTGHGQPILNIHK